MTNAPLTTLIGSSVSPRCAEGVAQPSICGLEGQRVPATLAAISKAGTGAFLSSNGNAFSTRATVWGAVFEPPMYGYQE